MKSLPILWKRLVDKGETCPRCGSTERNVAAAVAKLESALQPLGIYPVLETRAIDDVTFRAAPAESNRIWIGARPMVSRIAVKEPMMFGVMEPVVGV